MGKIFYDLTSSQNSIWLTEEFSSKTSMNIIGGYFLINDVVDFDALSQALNLYRSNNDVVELRFCTVNGIPKQYLTEYIPKQFPLINLASKNELEKYIRDFVKVPFDLTNNELFDCVLYKFPNGHGGFYAKFHHLIADAWSMSLFISEVAKNYASIIHGEKNVCNEPNPSYIDYIDSEKKYFSSKKFDKDKEYWDLLFNEEPIISHISNKSNANFDTNGKRLPFNLDFKTHQKINDFCKKNNCSINAFFLAIYSIYLAKINNNHSPILGVPVLNRSNFKDKHTSGMFISTVPFKADFSSDEHFSNYLSKIALTQLSVFRHQKYPYDVLLKDVKEKYGLNENLYDLVVSYQNARNDKSVSDIDYISTWEFTGHVSNALEVHFYDMDNTGTLKVYYDYQTSLFTEDDISSMHDRILEIVNLVLAKPDVEIKNIPVITKDEQKLFENDFNYSPYKYNENVSIVKLFEKQVSEHANDTAIIFEDKKMTYSELNSKANVIAKELLNKKVGKNDVVGIMLNRSFDILCCIWGVLKSGAAYLLIDPSLPQDRISYMLSNAGSHVLLSSSNMDIEFNNKIFVDNLDYSSKVHNICEKVDNNSLFCVIYTSGSTGLPKGVALKRNRSYKYGL